MSYPQLLISDIIQIAVLSVLVVQAFLINKTLKADHERRRKQATLEYINAVSERYKSALNEFNKRHGEDRFVDLWVRPNKGTKCDTENSQYIDII